MTLWCSIEPFLEPTVDEAEAAVLAELFFAICEAKLSSEARVIDSWLESPF